ncbi:MAG TPA: dihydrodipicolinate reductase C-terminal domain-containing protein [Vicinamibacterales bacterium]|nr:dihydrodipicolinate reductase C-terminal domain-containing protein [Vicinamibacterales bacterium]
MKLLLIGHGRMGRLVESLAPRYGCEVAGVVTGASGPDAIRSATADVAVDFSVPAAVPVNLPLLASRGMSVVIGTTGWQDREAELRVVVERAGIGVLAAANFSMAMHIFRQIVGEAARRFAARPDTGAWIHEAHHAAKKDAPSGTALMLKSAMQAAGYARAIDVSSTRAGSIPGTHVVGFDGPADTVTLAHEVRDRAVFAHGALEGARWLHGRRGWFGIDDMFQSRD